MNHSDSIKIPVDRIISRTDQLPSAPKVFTAAMELTSDLESKHSNLAQVLSADQSLTSKILRVSNSPFYGRFKKIMSVSEAIIVLGYTEIRTLIMATSISNLFDKSDPKNPQLKLWRHSLVTAITARQLATQIGYAKKEEAFVAGLLHDIGKLILMEKATKQYSQVICEVEKNQESFRDVEKRLLKIDHATIGKMLLEKWNLPNDLVKSVFRHHNPPALESTESVELCQIVFMANHIAKKLDVGFDDKKIDDICELEFSEVFSLNSENIEKIVEDVDGLYQDEILLY